MEPRLMWKIAHHRCRTLESYRPKGDPEAARKKRASNRLFVRVRFSWRRPMTFGMQSSPYNTDHFPKETKRDALLLRYTKLILRYTKLIL